MPKLATSPISSSLFLLDGVTHSRFNYDIAYGNILGSPPDEDGLLIGLSQKYTGIVIQEPVVFSDWTDDTDTPYASVSALLIAMNDIVGFLGTVPTPPTPTADFSALGITRLFSMLETNVDQVDYFGEIYYIDTTQQQKRYIFKDDTGVVSLDSQVSTTTTPDEATTLQDYIDTYTPTEIFINPICHISGVKLETPLNTDSPISLWQENRNQLRRPLGLPGVYFNETKWVSAPTFAECAQTEDFSYSWYGASFRSDYYSRMFATRQAAGNGFEQLYDRSSNQWMSRLIHSGGVAEADSLALTDTQAPAIRITTKTPTSMKAYIGDTLQQDIDVTGLSYNNDRAVRGAPHNEYAGSLFSNFYESFFAIHDRELSPAEVTTMNEQLALLTGYPKQENKGTFLTDKNGAYILTDTSQYDPCMYTSGTKTLMAFSGARQNDRRPIFGVWDHLTGDFSTNLTDPYAINAGADVHCFSSVIILDSGHYFAVTEEIHSGEFCAYRTTVAGDVSTFTKVSTWNTNSPAYPNLWYIGGTIWMLFRASGRFIHMVRSNDDGDTWFDNIRLIQSDNVDRWCYPRYVYGTDKPRICINLRDNVVEPNVYTEGHWFEIDTDSRTLRNVDGSFVYDVSVSGVYQIEPANQDFAIFNGASDPNVSLSSAAYDGTYKIASVNGTIRRWSGSVWETITLTDENYVYFILAEKSRIMAYGNGEFRLFIRAENAKWGGLDNVVVHTTDAFDTYTVARYQENTLMTRPLTPANFQDEQQFLVAYTKLGENFSGGGDPELGYSDVQIFDGEPTT